MAKVRPTEPEEGLNPYIALADVGLNLALVLLFFVVAVNAVGQAGWEQVRYREAQAQFTNALSSALPERLRPVPSDRNDPPGAQRWRFPQKVLFRQGTASLSPTGRYVLVKFAAVLREHHEREQLTWRRIRIEGHSMPPSPGQMDDWELSCARAAKVARVFAGEGHIPAYFMSVSGRAGQNPLGKARTRDPENERVEIILEYAQKAAPAATPNHPAGRIPHPR